MKVSRLRQATVVAGARIIGFGAYQPSTVVTSEETAKRFGRTGEWVRGRTGIVSLRKAGATETVHEMAIAAGRQALANSGIEASRIGLVIVASCSAEKPMPDVASEVAQRIGARTAGAFDLNAACAGFCYALTVAADVVRNGSAEYVLVVGTERMTAWVDPADLGTSILFGDGAGAAVVGPSAEPGIGPVGNTSAASIPLALQRLVEAKAVERDSLALLIGFGAGLSYAAQVVTLP